MTTKKLLPVACLAAAIFATIYLPAEQLFAQGRSSYTERAVVSPDPPPPPPTEPTAIIRAGLAQPVIIKSSDGSFAQVGLTRGQLVDIAVQYPAAKAGDAIVAVPLDGGRVIAPLSLVVAGDGVIRFQFQAGNQVGAYQVALHDGAQELGLHFWVLDEQHPEKNPVVVNLKN